MSEAAAVAIKHDVKGNALVCFVVLRSLTCGFSIDNSKQQPLESELRMCVRKKIGPVASPDHIIIVESIPKTRSGKVVRRLLRQIATCSNNYGDISTVANPECIQSIESSWSQYLKRDN